MEPDRCAGLKRVFGGLAPVKCGDDDTDVAPRGTDGGMGELGESDVYCVVGCEEGCGTEFGGPEVVSSPCQLPPSGMNVEGSNLSLSFADVLTLLSGPPDKGDGTRE